MPDVILDNLLEARRALDAVIADEALRGRIAAAGTRLADSFRQGGRVYSCGNGGSMCDAMHFAEELSGRYRDNRAGLPAMAISDPGYLSCAANDFGYDAVFARFVEAHGRAGDCLLAFSTSGKSRNVLAAAEAARARGLTVIALTGKPDSALSALADIELCTPGGRFADRVQELHIKLVHTLIELVERALFPENYPPESPTPAHGSEA